MRRTGLGGRLDRIEGTCGQGEVRDLARRLAEVTGTSEGELIAEAERIAQTCHEQRITSTAGMVQYVATELGIVVEELEAEMACFRKLIR